MHERPTFNEWRVYLANHVLKQMMFVSGETGDPSTETTGIIEEIVRQQVVEIVMQSFVSVISDS